MRLIVNYDHNTGHVNIESDYIEESDGVLKAFLGDTLVGVFSTCAIEVAYLSGDLKQSAAKPDGKQVG